MTDSKATQVGMTKSSEIARIPVFDVARAVACFLVVATHVRVNQFLPYGAVQSDFGTAAKFLFFQATRLGLEAVLVFFCLSGFLIISSVSESIRKGNFSLTRYAVNRLARIYTPYVPSIFVSILLAIVLQDRIDISNVLLNLLCLQGIATHPLELNSSLWSVSYEVWFYLVLGLLAAAITSKSMRFFLLASLSLLAFTSLKPSYLFCWMIGGIASFAPARKNLSILAVSLTLLTVGCLVTQMTSKSEQVDLTRFSFVNADVGVILFGTGCSCMLLSLRYLLRPEGLTATIANFFARFSYSTYLFHIPCIVVLKELKLLSPYESLSVKSLAVYCSNILVIYVVSYLMYLLFERRTPQVKRWLESLTKQSVRAKGRA